MVEDLYLLQCFSLWKTTMFTTQSLKDSQRYTPINLSDCLRLQHIHCTYMLLVEPCPYGRHVVTCKEAPLLPLSVTYICGWKPPDQKPTDAGEISPFTEDRKGDVTNDIPCLRPKVFSVHIQSCQMVRSSKDLTLE